jgi:N-acetyltransferase
VRYQRSHDRKLKGLLCLANRRWLDRARVIAENQNIEMPSPIQVSAVVLSGHYVRVEPLSSHHAASLGRAFDLRLFQYFGSVRPATADEAGMLGYIRAVTTLPNVVPFAFVLQSTGEPVGASSYMDIRAADRGLEIGMTWILGAHQGTEVNPEAKLLMLEHAFEVLGCERVQLKCDARNLQSQAAITKLGAKFEGRLRRHLILPDGYIRDTMMYSILPAEWPGVKSALQRRLAPK